MSAYQRRGDYDDLPLVAQMGILVYELDHVAVTAEEKRVALEAIEGLKYTIEVTTPKPAPEGYSIWNQR